MNASASTPSFASTGHHAAGRVDGSSRRRGALAQVRRNLRVTGLLRETRGRRQGFLGLDREAVRLHRFLRPSLVFSRGGRAGNGERASAARTSSSRAHVRHELGPERAATRSSSSAIRTCACERLGFELLHPRVHRSISLLHVEHALDAGQVQAELGRHLLDAPQPLDVVLRVEARALRRALRLDQPPRLVHPQRLRVHVRRARRRPRS